MVYGCSLTSQWLGPHLLQIPVGIHPKHGAQTLCGPLWSHFLKSCPLELHSQSTS